MQRGQRNRNRHAWALSAKAEAQNDKKRRFRVFPANIKESAAIPDEEDADLALAASLQGPRLSLDGAPVGR
jgi:hypothetical protein